MTAFARQKNSNVLVAYVSMTGTTAKVAQMLANVIDGELYEIEPEKYTNADLNWRNEQSRYYVEMHDLKFRPALKGKKANIADYDTIYIGFPIWWNIVSTLLNPFFEAHNLKGKTVIPFATSGGSTIDNSVKELKKAYPDSNWQEGKLLKGADKNSIRQWLKK